tara:strand:- start:137 stop:334 length:198 start_codon:yes stop_codon:yes gene_type:complete
MDIVMAEINKYTIILTLNNNLIISFEVNKEIDTVNRIINELKEENCLFNNDKYFSLILKIFLKKK